jgi:hypothetical protein
MAFFAGSVAVTVTSAKCAQLALEGWQARSSEKDSLRKKASETGLG